MANLVPHPLVTDVGLDLRKEFAALDTAAQALDDAGKPKKKRRGDTTESGPVSTTDDETQHPVEENNLARVLADQANLPDLSLFAGYLGGPVEHEGADWRLLYLDSRLNNWLLVPEDQIVVHQRLTDANAASGLRDALWVRGSATLVRGSGSRAKEGRFLVGEFTRAGDFAASTTGGTFSAASGLLCEATTPGCCWGARSR
ncbi:MAG TPA: hypothetical protein VI006_08910 [Solirubrobacteraceae bacterium]|jgi:hypothetical protein